MLNVSNNLQRDFTALAQRAVDRSLRRSSERIYYQLLADTPVDTGFLRSNWHVLPQPRSTSNLLFGDRESLIIDNSIKYFLPSSIIPLGFGVDIVNNTRYGAFVAQNSGFLGNSLAVSYQVIGAI